MRILMIGGTGTISSAVSARLIEEGCELFMLNRGSRNRLFEGATPIVVSDANDEDEVRDRLGGMEFDVVCDFIAFTREQVERDARLFEGRTGQYVFISSASAYRKPPSDYLINEGVSLANPFWKYARDKIECEEFLMQAYRESGFPVTIVRPSHTYCERSVPVGLHGRKGSWQVVKRLLEGRPVLIHGDGSSLWTMTDSRDFAAGFVGLLANPRAIGEAYQITSDESLSWNQIYGIIAKNLGVELVARRASSEFLAAVSEDDLTGPLLGDKANCVVFDNSKLKRLVPDFRPRISFDEGAARTIDYVLSHPELQVEDPEFDRWCDRVVDALDAAAARFPRG